MGERNRQNIFSSCFLILIIIHEVSSQAWTLSNLLMAGTKATSQGLGYSDTIAQGAQKGLDECKTQFQWNIWNCPQNVFTQIFSKNNPMPTNRETAFVHAIISAGIVHTVTRNCSKGQFDKCRCDPTKSGKGEASNPATKGKFRWGGCSDDIEFGINLAKSFLDEREIGHDPKALINLHNNNVGRMAVKNTMEITCKCHGVSGSCTTKTCWMRVAEFGVIGDYLKDAYTRAMKLSSSSKNKERVKKGIADQLSLASISSTVTGINDNASPSKSRLEQEMANLPVTRLAFTEDAADYCHGTGQNNGTSGSKATAGRTCSRRKGPGVPHDERKSCRNLCKACGLKVKKQRKKITTTCNCKFHWCCQVHCSSCEKEETTFTCSL